MARKAVQVAGNPKWPASNIEWRQTRDLLAYQRNSRIHSDAQVDQIAASMKEFGWTIPMLIDEDGIIIAGHGRAMAAAKIGISEVPVMIAKGWTEAQKMAYRIADNRLPESASWDTDMLKLELTELGKMDFDLSLTGFDDLELVQFMAEPNTNDPEETPAPPANPASKAGDLWLLGRHRLLCADSSDEREIKLVLEGKKPAAIVTDPPYGVGVEYDTFIDTEQNAEDLVSLLMPRLFSLGCPIALTPGVPMMWKYPQPEWVMVWVHPAPTGGCSWGFAGVNPILVYGKDPYLSKGMGRHPDHIVMAADREGVEGHPTPKPFKVWSWLVERLTPNPKQLVFDPFCGSGTTIIACEALTRNCAAIELSPAYVDVCVLRWQTYTGQEATLEATGETYAEVAEKRLNPPVKPARKRKASA
jgi:hypothetical protein